MAQIRANSILPARRRDTPLETTDGLTPVGELALVEQEDPIASLICLHPMPTHRGMMASAYADRAAAVFRAELDADGDGC